MKKVNIIPFYIFLFVFTANSQSSVKFTYEGEQITARCSNQGCNNWYKQDILPKKLIEVNNGRVEDAAIALYSLINYFLINSYGINNQNCNNLNFRKCNFNKTEEIVKETLFFDENDLLRINKRYNVDVYNINIGPLTYYFNTHPIAKREFEERGRQFEKSRLEKLEAEAKAKKYAEEQKNIEDKRKKEAEELAAQNEIRLYKEKLSKIQLKPLSENEKLFIGNWKFVSDYIFLKNGEVLIMEESWSVKSDRTYKYESRFKKYLENKYFNNYLEIGVFEIEEDTYGNIYVVANIIEEDNQPSKRIDKMKFDKLKENKAVRVIQDIADVKYPFKLRGKKMILAQ
ncbi:MAG: hypothetical protein KA210_12625 [Bacteroidia bacterium]|nr:hypothetical protein [Bacteroidia bacterium]